MKKFHNKAFGIIVLAMLATAPLSMSYSFADDSSESKQKITKSTKSNQEGLRAILTEKVVDGKLQVKRFALPENLSENDMNRMISFKGETSGWAYVKQKAYQSGIILFDGKASKVGKNLWEISTRGTLQVQDKTFDLDLKGKSNGSRVVMQGTAQGGELVYKVVFSGKMVEAGSETFAVIFTNSGLKNPESGHVIKIDQIGELTMDSHGKANHGFGKSVLVG